MIKELYWDSNFFGYKVGRIDINDNQSVISNFEKTNYRLVYVFSELEIVNLSPIDKKVNFEKIIRSSIEIDNEIIEFDCTKHNYSELLNLAYLSGIYSRFNLDKAFSESDFKRMYQIWIDESIKKNIAFSILVRIIDKTIAGFVTIEKKNENTSRIGLISVAPNFQGKGIASQLIFSAEKESSLHGYKNLEVATQYNNKPAMQLYKKNGFAIKSITNIYHIWNK